MNLKKLSIFVAVLLSSQLFFSDSMVSAQNPSGVRSANHQVESTRFDAVGVLRRDPMSTSKFVLADQAGRVRYRVSPNAGLDLVSLLGTKVGIQGQSRFYPKENVYRIRAVAVSQLNRSGNPIQLTSATEPAKLRPPKDAKILQASATKVRRVAQGPSPGPVHDALPTPVPDPMHTEVIEDGVITGRVIYEGSPDTYYQPQSSRYGGFFGIESGPSYGCADAGCDECFPECDPCYDHGYGYGHRRRRRLFSWSGCGPLSQAFLKPGGGWMLAVDGLFWQPRLRSTDIGFSDPNGNATVEGTLQSLEWSGNAGGRIELAYQFCNRWELGGTFTGYNDNSTESFMAPAGGVIRPVYDPTQTTTAATSTGEIELSIIDIEVGRTLSLHKSSAIRFFAGPRFAHYQQSVDSNYVGLGNDISTVKWDGVGARAGAEGRWFCNPYWSLFAEGSFSLLATNFDTVRATPNYVLAENFNKIVPVTEMSLGLTRHIGQCALSVSYEINHWGDAVEMLDPSNTRVSDIGFNGLFLRFGIRR